MHSILTHLVAVQLVIHALFGCCWHHVDRCEQVCPAADSAVGVDCCAKHAATGGDERSDAPCQCRLECKGVCTYVPTPRIALDLGGAVSPIDAVLSPVLAAEHLVAMSVGSRRVCSPCDLAASPRLYLLHQILLI